MRQVACGEAARFGCRDPEDKPPPGGLVRRAFSENFFEIVLQIEIEVEIVYNMYRVRRLLSQGPPSYAIQGTYKSRLDR
jgi:hypothetical protein